MRWTYGITTVPQRKDDLFPQTLNSLRKAGFDQPYLFIDGCDPYLARNHYKQYGLGVTPRESRVRTAGHWVMSMLELYYRDPNADRYAMFQDDFVTYKNLKQYLDKAPYPEKSYLNLYTFPSNQSLCDGKIGWFRARNLNSGPTNFQTGRGAVALIFSNEALVTLFSSAHLFKRAKDARYGHRKIDGGIVQAMNEQGWSEFCHNPSLTQHMGDKSSIEGQLPHQKALSFLGENYDAMELLEVSCHQRPNAQVSRLSHPKR